jgi:ATP-dependent DNA helicase RecG
MNLGELRKLVKKGESDRLEFKRSTGQRSEASKTVCAMLNGLGGHVLFGVRNDAELIGQDVSEQTLNKLAAELGRIEPPAFPDIETLHLEQGRAIIVLTISGAMGPYTFDGRPYLRRGPTTVVMHRDEYERRLVERLHATRRWENEPATDGVSIEDLDAEEIRTTLDNAVRLGRLETARQMDIETILRGLELIRDGRLLNAAVALYGKSDHLRSLYPQMGIRLARFRGKDRLADFADNRQYWGHAFGLLRRAESFLLDHVPIAGRVVPGKLVREDQPWYPPRATREAMANALCHRDYAIPGGAVALALYDDHLEIANPGAFHFGITPEKLALPHESRPWNPIIANVFYRAGIIERWGSGTLNILTWCRENGNPAPEWLEQTGSVYVTFSPALQPLPEKPTEQVTAQVDKTNDISLLEAAMAKLDGLTEQVTAQVTAQVVSFCRTPRKATEIMELLGIKHRMTFLRNYLDPMLEIGIIERTIPEKPTSSKQKYQLGSMGWDIIKSIESLRM